MSAENFAGMEAKIRTQRELIKELEDKITTNTQEIEKVDSVMLLEGWGRRGWRRGGKRGGGGEEEKGRGRGGGVGHMQSA